MTDKQASPGVVLFDDPLSRGAGWACFAGDEPRRISSASELSTAAVWLTNLDDARLTAAGMANNRFRAQDFLRVNLTSLACEIGCATPVNGGQFREATGAGCAKTLAELFGAVMDVSVRFGVETYPPYQLRIGYRRAHYRAEQANANDSATSEALRQACQRYTTSERRQLERREKYDERTTIFVRHRHTHALEVLSQPVPSGAWRATPRMTPDEIVAHPRPLLLEVQVQEMNEEIGSVVNFGGVAKTQYVRAGLKQIDASPRRWMTQPEYRFLRQHGKISVISSLEAEGYRDNPLLPMVPAFNVLQGISPAFQLAMESYWTSAYRDERGRTDHSAIAAWMSAYDRLACLREAMHLSTMDQGVDVIGFGYGRVIVKTLNPGTKFGSWCWDMIAGRALIPPMAVDGPFEAPVSDPEDPVQVLQAVQLAGDPQTIMSTDQPAIEDFDAETAAIISSQQETAAAGR